MRYSTLTSQARRQLTGRLALLLSLLFCGGSAVMAAPPLDAAAWDQLQPGSILLIRHANAPGISDPDGFKLNDCASQRNLDDNGRAQARRIGEQLRRHGVKVTAVLTSQWCRTRDTAELAFPGLVRDDANFNSFYEASALEKPQTAAALATLSAWRGPGVLVVVSHQVNITAVTGIYPASGEGVVLRPKPGGVEVLTRLRFD
jgi:phosphohistidine phosphatase SixA